jgi:Na+-transporting NADH:ubiquinone oxidoreductase subunit B
MEPTQTKKLFLMQKVMLRVCYALLPLVFASVYLFGWRSFAVVLVVLGFGIATEALFTLRQGKPITSAVFVTSLIFSLSLPPMIPFWMAVVGIVVGVALGKMVFGGFGQNVFNPAMVGRCFLYVTFPIEMTNQWASPLWGGAAGFGRWSLSLDAVTQATPLVESHKGISVPLEQLFFGNTAGSLGETSALLILLGGICLIGGILLSSVLHGFGAAGVPSALVTLLSGSFLFGSVFVVTEPISGAKTEYGQWIYGFMVGSLIVVLRGFSNFPEGVMFSILIMNAFVPLIDQAVRRMQASKKAVP